MRTSTSATSCIPIFEDTSLGIKPLGKFRTKNPTLLTRLKIEVPSGKNTNQLSCESIQAVTVATAKAKAAKQAAMEAASVENEKTGDSGNGSRRMQKTLKKGLTGLEEKEANREKKRLLKLIGAVVVKYMSKYSKSVDHHLFKNMGKRLVL